MLKILVSSLLILSCAPVYAAGELDSKECLERAKKAGTIFVNEIMAESVVDTATVSFTGKDKTGDYIYSVETANASGTRLRDVFVVTDPWCNIQSVSRQ